MFILHASVIAIITCLYMDKLQLTGQALGQVFNFRSGCMHTMHLLPSVAIQPNLELRTRPKQLLGSLLLVIVLPGLQYRPLVSCLDTFCLSLTICTVKLDCSYMASKSAYSAFVLRVAPERCSSLSPGSLPLPTNFRPGRNVCQRQAYWSRATMTKSKTFYKNFFFFVTAPQYNQMTKFVGDKPFQLSLKLSSQA